MSDETKWRKITEEHFKEYLFILGLTVEQARTCLAFKKMKLHVSNRDGKPTYGCTMEVDDNRLNVIVKEDIVIGIDSIM